MIRMQESNLTLCYHLLTTLCSNAMESLSIIRFGLKRRLTPTMLTKQTLAAGRMEI